MKTEIKYMKTKLIMARDLKPGDVFIFTGSEVWDRHTVIENDHQPCPEPNTPGQPWVDGGAWKRDCHRLTIEGGQIVYLISGQMVRRLEA